MKVAQIALGIFLSVGGLLTSLALGIYFVYWGIVDLQAGKITEGFLKLFLWAEIAGLLSILCLLAPGLYLIRKVRPDPTIPPSP
ncbi:MAG: hypothetical protein H6727_08970 [Myxococcales bacterium]|nr:hypothetical protein [Myxococcales bacterium]